MNRKPIKNGCGDMVRFIIGLIIGLIAGYTLFNNTHTCESDYVDYSTMSEKEVAEHKKKAREESIFEARRNRLDPDKPNGLF